MRYFYHQRKDNHRGGKDYSPTCTQVLIAAMISDSIDIQQFGKLKVFDESATSIQLSSLWENCTAVLVFIRHFG